MTNDYRPIPDFAGRYEVNDQGVVRRVARTITDVNGHVRRLKALPLTGSLNAKGYRVVKLTDATGDKAQHRVHRLVLATFVGPCPDGMEARHLNGEPDDNRLANLQWGTRSENTLDQVIHGTHANAAKTQCPRGHALDAPNLKPSHFRHGQRTCLACHRAASWAHNRARRGIETHEVTQRNEAMLRYWEIIANDAGDVALQAVHPSEVVDQAVDANHVATEQAAA